MNFFWNKNKKMKEPIEERSAFGDYLSYNVSTAYSDSKAMLLSAVYRCVNVIADSAAQLPLEPYKVDSNGYKMKFTKHSTYRVLNKEPNKNMSRFTFIHLMMSQMLLSGNAFAYIERDTKGNCMALHYIPSALVTINKPTKLGGQVSYTVVGFNGFIEACNMVHILNYTVDGIEGISTLRYARNTLGLALDSEANAQGFFKGGANLAGILKANTSLSPDKKRHLKESWNQAFGQNGEPNGVAILDADLDFQSVTVNPADAQLLESRQYNVIDICRFFGVSPVKAFDLSKSSYNTIEQMQLAFLTDTLQPLLEKFEEEFERKLFKPSEKDSIDVRFDTSALLRADKQSLANYYNTLFQIGAISPNEIRRELDLPMIEDGDRTFVQVNVQTLDNAVNKTTEEEKDSNQTT